MMFYRDIFRTLSIASLVILVQFTVFTKNQVVVDHENLQSYVNY
jgi:hypothetical protein